MRKKTAKKIGQYALVVFFEMAFFAYCFFCIPEDRPAEAAQTVAEYVETETYCFEEVVTAMAAPESETETEIVRHCTTEDVPASLDEALSSVQQEECYADLINGNEELLVRMAMAEAGNQGTEGKAYVMMVVINRCLDSRFPNTVEEVLYAPHQFSTVSSGRIWSVTPDQECYDALTMIKSGWDMSQGAIYFESTESGFAWAHYLFTYGGHRFYD